MKVLFYDGALDKDQLFAECYLRTLWNTDIFYVDAMFGPEAARVKLDMLLHREDCGKNVAVITNSLMALDTKYCWNERIDSCELYFFIRSRGEFVEAQDLTDKMLRRSNNFIQMYLNGAFNLD